MSINDLVFNTEEEAVLALRHEAERAIKLIQRIWAQYEGSYKPIKYIRTHKVQNALAGLAVGVVEKIDENTLGIRIAFKDDLMYHPSIVNKDTGKPEGHAFMLISEGWRVNENAKHAQVHHFGYYEGYDIIDKVISAFESEKEYKGIALTFYWAGMPFEKKPKQPNVLRG